MEHTSLGHVNASLCLGEAITIARKVYLKMLSRSLDAENVNKTPILNGIGGPR